MHAQVTECTNDTLFDMMLPTGLFRFIYSVLYVKLKWLASYTQMVLTCTYVYYIVESK